MPIEVERPQVIAQDQPFQTSGLTIEFTVMPFQPFNTRAAVRIYYTSMPHWRQEGATYFVTYRMADSIPERVLKQWDEEKIQWLQQRGIHDKSWGEGFARLDTQSQREFLKHFNRKLNAYLDEGHGECVLRETMCGQIVLEGWRHFDGLHYELGDLVVMPNHVHLLITPGAGHKLEHILQSRKRHSAREINLHLGRSGDFWQKHSYDHIVRDELELEAFQKYIADNPARAALREGEFVHRGFDWQRGLEHPIATVSARTELISTGNRSRAFQLPSPANSRGR